MFGGNAFNKRAWSFCWLSSTDKGSYSNEKGCVFRKLLESHDACFSLKMLNGQGWWDTIANSLGTIGAWVYELFPFSNKEIVGLDHGLEQKSRRTVHDAFNAVHTWEFPATLLRAFRLKIPRFNYQGMWHKILHEFTSSKKTSIVHQGKTSPSTSIPQLPFRIYNTTISQYPNQLTRIINYLSLNLAVSNMF